MAQGDMRTGDKRTPCGCAETGGQGDTTGTRGHHEGTQRWVAWGHMGPRGTRGHMRTRGHHGDTMGTSAQGEVGQWAMGTWGDMRDTGTGGLRAMGMWRYGTRTEGHGDTGTGRWGHRDRRPQGNVTQRHGEPQSCSTWGHGDTGTQGDGDTGTWEHGGGPRGTQGWHLDGDGQQLPLGAEPEQAEGGGQELGVPPEAPCGDPRQQCVVGQEDCPFLGGGTQGGGQLEHPWTPGTPPTTTTHPRTSGGWSLGSPQVLGALRILGDLINGVCPPPTPRRTLGSLRVPGTPPPHPDL